jgi:hypothetical protein
MRDCLIPQSLTPTSAQSGVNVYPFLLARWVSAFVCSPVRGLFIRRVFHASTVTFFALGGHSSALKE